ncbi:MAG TPA: sigma-70 family RNA polymerase sigma factor [Verrucomicrobiae bacterium]|nr:sigma-70 family RNA polymerase sigma factor [Verrucomicrobiae bacterium]
MTTGKMPVAGDSDAQLVEWSLTGDREAFGRIVERYQSLVCSITYGATGSLTLSEDLAQETFVTAWKRLSELREPTKLRAWLCGITRFLIGKELRRQGREPVHAAEPLDTVQEPAAPEPSPSARAIGREEEAILWRALEQMPTTYREPLILFYREHQSVARVAEELELSEDAVKQRLSRGRTMLTEQVAAFVEGALQQTTPGRAFTLGVLAALPALTTSVKTATAALSEAAHHGTTTLEVTKALAMTTTQKILIATAAASVAVATSTAVYETHHTSQLQEEIRTLEQQQEPLTEQVRQLRQERDGARHNVAVLQQENEQLRLDTAELVKLRGKMAQLQAPVGPSVAATGSKLAERLKNPQTRQEERTQQRWMIYNMYGGLSKYLNLPADEMDALKELLVERNMANLDALVSIESQPEVDPKQLNEARTAVQAEYNRKIQDLLGPQDYAIFEDYNKSASFRWAVQTFKSELPVADALTDQQENDLVHAIFEASNTVPVSPELWNLPVDRSQWTEEQVAEWLKAEELRHQLCVERAATVLSPAQLERFETYQDEDYAMQAEYVKGLQKSANKAAVQPPTATQSEAH